MKKLLSVITLLVLLAGSAFAENFISYGWFKNDDLGEYYVCIDIDAREPYDAYKEQLLYFIDLQKRGFSKVEVHWYKLPEDCKLWAATISKVHNVYCIVEEYENYNIISHVCSDDTVIEYVCYKNKEEK